MSRREPVGTVTGVNVANPAVTTPTPAAPWAWALATALWLLGCSLPIILFTSSARSHSEAVPLAVVTVIYTATRLAWLFGRGEAKIASTVLFMFAYITMGVVPLAQINTGIFTNLIDPTTLFHAQVIALVALVCYDLAPLLVSTASSPEMRAAWAQAARAVNPTRLHVGAVLALAATAYYINSVGGPSQFFLSRQDLGVALTDAGFRTSSSQVASAILQNIGQVPILFVWAAYTARMIRRPDTRTIGMKLWWLVLLTGNVVVNNPISNPRYWFLTVVAGTVYALPRLSANLYRLTIIGGLLGALLVFPYADVFRYQAANRSDVVIKPIAETLASKDFDQWTMTANGVWFGDGLGHTFGAQILGVVLFFVPRSIWPNKPMDTGVLVGRHVAGAGTDNLSSPLWTELWIDFGIVGVILGFFVLGIIARRAEDRFAAMGKVSSSEPLVVQVLLPFLVGYGFILLRGPLLQAMSHLAVMLAVAWALRGKRLADLSEGGSYESGTIRR
jgi:hypothetical protein